MNTPNRLTMSRILFAIGVFVLFALIRRAQAGNEVLQAGLPTFGWVGLILFIVAALTDVLDGHLARRRKIVSDFGRIADPFADKILICGSLVFICATDGLSDIVPPWAVVVILAREFLVTGIRGFIEARGKSFAARAAGKLKMLLQSVLVGGVFFKFGPGRNWDDIDFILLVLMLATVAVTIYSGWAYVRGAMRILREDDAPPAEPGDA